MIDKKIQDEIERLFRCGYYTFDQIMRVYNLTREDTLSVIIKALEDGNYANFDPRSSDEIDEALPGRYEFIG